MSRHLRATRWLLSVSSALAFAPALAHASYYDLTEENDDPQQCIMYDVRFPYWTNGVYIATYPGNIRSQEGWLSEYYGGVVSSLKGDSQLIQYASWQMKGKGAPASGIDFVHAGRHMSWVRSTWEGSSGGIKGRWPNAEFKPGAWYRFVNRAWTPATPVPHLGYAGVWMKDIATGTWHHLATFKFPAQLTGFNRMGGFCEFFTDNASDSCAVEFRHSYAMRKGAWRSEPTFKARNHKEDTITLAQPADQGSVILTTTRTPIDPLTKKHEVIKAVAQKATLHQPETPADLDVATISAPTAERIGNQLVVTWRVDATSAPQLGYAVDLLEGGTPIATRTDHDPGSRQCVLEVADGSRATQARIRITDIFGQTSAPVTIPIRTTAPLPPCTAPATSAGLSYRYFESAQPGQWRTIPDFATLTPIRQGVVATPDLTPRLKRVGYAFAFTGFLRVPTTGLYAFNLISACGARLILDGRTVVDADGYHSIARTTGAVALDPGLHTIAIPYYQGERQLLQADDFLQLTWSGPGFPDQSVPASAFCRPTVPDEPAITVKAVRQGAGGVNLQMTAAVTPATMACERIEYYAVNPGFDYYGAQGAHSADYLLADSRDPAVPTPAVLWGGTEHLLRARLVYAGGRTMDSMPFLLPQAASRPAEGGNPQGFVLTQLEHHLYPMAFSEDQGIVTVVGESMGLLTRPFVGNGTITARLADITSSRPQADGTELMDAGNWYAGVIMRGNLDARPGEPLGGSQIPYAAVLATANQRTRYCDSTMINGAGNQPGYTGNGDRWLKIARQGTDFTLSSSADGKTWNTIKTVSLPKMPDALHAGFVIYSIPCATNRIHWARFDHVAFTRS